MPRYSQERKFEYQIQNKLQKHGWLVINCARSKPFDLIAIPPETKSLILHGPLMIELKGKDGKYPPEQHKMQLQLSIDYNLLFAVIKQLKARGKREVALYYHGDPISIGFLDLIDFLKTM